MKPRNFFSIFTAVAGLFLAGCASTQQSESVDKSGFLGDYSMLTKGKEGYALLRYVKPGVDFRKYKGVLIEPVTIWTEGERSTKELAAEDAARLAQQLEKKLTDVLKAWGEIAEKPGKGVLRLRVALTEAEGANVTMKTMSSLIPVGMVIQGGKKLATGTYGYVGKAAIELEVTDSLTNERLAAAVDKRIGGKAYKDLLSTWAEVEKSFEHWAELTRKRLEQAKKTGTF